MQVLQGRAKGSSAQPAALPLSFCCVCSSWAMAKLLLKLGLTRDFGLHFGFDSGCGFGWKKGVIRFAASEAIVVAVASCRSPALAKWRGPSFRVKAFPGLAS